jgi:NAD(P)-dependent dehydrogenase (short-subunit alcohol dehydrogenase family)
MRGVALVTGGKKRLGAAIAECLCSAGYAVIIHAKVALGEADALADRLKRAGGRATAIAGDLSDLAALDDLMARASAPFGPVTLLVNNASTFVKDDLSNLTPGGFSAALAVNLQAPVLLAQAMAQRLPADASGAIINVIDQRVLKPNPTFFSYSVAKAGLFWCTKTLAQALAPSIRVNAVGPGPTLPNTHDGADLFHAEAAGTLLGAPVSPQAIAEAVLFLASARHVTGQMIAVDSGQHLGWKTPDIVGD